MKDVVRVGLLGWGTVGGAVARILLDHGERIGARAGVRIELARVAVRDRTSIRSVPIPPTLLAEDAFEVVRDPAVDVVVETMGGSEPAKDLILTALRNGKHVVTANKELLAAHGAELMDAAADGGVDLLFEGAVAGGIPIIRPLRESLAGDRVSGVLGIVNGTTNFILTLMSETGCALDEALTEAQRRGYAESDPSADIDGRDAASKLAIIASIAFDSRVSVQDVMVEGIGRIGPADIEAARDLGYTIKLIAVARSYDDGVSLRVHPAMVPLTHPLAAVRDVFNALFIQGDEVGDLMFYGRGAGAGPTGAAVVGDVIDLARHIASGGRSPAAGRSGRTIRLCPPEETVARYYVVLYVADRAGVLAQVAGVFGRHGISIASLRQEGRGDEATLEIITHAAPEGSLARTFEDLDRLEEVEGVGSRIRVIGDTDG